MFFLLVTHFDSEQVWCGLPLLAARSAGSGSRLG